MGDLGDDEGNAPSLAGGRGRRARDDGPPGQGTRVPRGACWPVLAPTPAQANPGEFVIGGDGRVAASGSRAQRPTTKRPILAGDRPRRSSRTSRAAKTEEDIRLLYVAMTRAEDRLVLVGARPTGSKAEARRIGRIVTALGLDALPDPGSDRTARRYPRRGHRGVAGSRRRRGTHPPGTRSEPRSAGRRPCSNPRASSICRFPARSPGRSASRRSPRSVVARGGSISSASSAWDLSPASGAGRRRTTGGTPGREETLLDDAESYSGPRRRPGRPRPAAADRPDGRGTRSGESARVGGDRRGRRWPWPVEQRDRAGGGARRRVLGFPAGG